ncbi:MAG: glycosyltransferase [Acidimicrobiaceae bacterium]|nr:glycosyltransferase [Acidimicrobiaceae bacterium]
MRLENTLRIDQLLPSFAPMDAIGYHALKMQELIRSLGIRSEIYADEIKGELQGRAQPFATFARSRYRPHRYLIYQTSTGSPIANHLINRREPILLNYHNITPKEILGRWDIGIGMVVGAGIKQLSVLREKIIGAISVSEYNRWCLKQEGITKNSLVAVPFIPLAQQSIDSFENRKANSCSNWLFVGRIAPNKAQHDIIKAFSAYLTGWDHDATLTLVGSISSQKYADTLEQLITSLGIQENVQITGPVGDAELERHYRKATVFVCLSDHEGFGFPIIEALNHSLPVVAFAQAAIPETLGTSGILISSKDPLHVAASVAMIERGNQLTNDIRERAKLTVARYTPEAAKQENLTALQSLIPEMTNQS